MDTINTTATRQPITTTCRCCHGEMGTDWQPPLMKHREGYFIITCWNKDCALFEYTVADINYAEMDLSAYPCKAVA